VPLNLESIALSRFDSAGCNVPSRAVLEPARRGLIVNDGSPLKSEPGQGLLQPRDCLLSSCAIKIEAFINVGPLGGIR
jgi:hypothetical protein